MSLDTIRAAITTRIRWADPVSLVHDYERWSNEPNAFESLYIPADQPNGDRYVRAWLIKWLSVQEVPFTHESRLAVHTFALRFLHSVKDDAASEQAAAAIVEAVRQSISADPTLGLAGVTIQPWAGNAKGIRGAQLDRHEYLQLSQVLCHFCELRLAVQESA